MDASLQSHAQRLDYLSRRLISPLQQIAIKSNQIKLLQNRLDMSMQRYMQMQQQRLLSLHNSLAQLNPHSVLARGYAMVQDSAGKLVSDANQLSPTQKVHITFAQGNADAVISTTKPK